jgi:hypothetical protein
MDGHADVMSGAGVQRFALLSFVLVGLSFHAAQADSPKPLTIKTWLAELQLAPTQAIIDYCRAALPDRAKDLKDARAEYLRNSNEAMARVTRKLSPKELDAPAPPDVVLLVDFVIKEQLVAIKKIRADAYCDVLPDRLEAATVDELEKSIATAFERYARQFYAKAGP